MHPESRPVICILAGSSLPSDESIALAAKALGKAIGEGGYDLLYGGGSLNIMGLVAGEAQKAGASIHAVTLEKYRHEQQIEGASVTFVQTEAERFATFSGSENLVAWFVLPGGPGTIREALQALEKAVYDNGPPLTLVEVSDYLDGIKHYFNRAVSGGLVREGKEHCLKTWQPGQSIQSVLADDDHKDPPATPSAGTSVQPR